MGLLLVTHYGGITRMVSHNSSWESSSHDEL